MLVLGRKTNERICINGDIEVMILRIDSNRVTLGITAPRDVTIRRGGLPEAFGSATHTLELAASTR